MNFYLKAYNEGWSFLQFLVSWLMNIIVQVFCETVTAPKNVFFKLPKIKEERKSGLVNYRGAFQPGFCKKQIKCENPGITDSFCKTHVVYKT
jgi:hypothetical protein